MIHRVRDPELIAFADAIWGFEPDGARHFADGDPILALQERRDRLFPDVGLVSAILLRSDSAELEVAIRPPLCATAIQSHRFGEQLIASEFRC